jgi:hypothetical protein
MTELSNGTDIQINQLPAQPLLTRILPENLQKKPRMKKNLKEYNLHKSKALRPIMVSVFFEHIAVCSPNWGPMANFCAQIYPENRSVKSDCNLFETLRIVSLTFFPCAGSFKSNL